MYSQLGIPGVRGSTKNLGIDGNRCYGGILVVNDVGCCAKGGFSGGRGSLTEACNASNRDSRVQPLQSFRLVAEIDARKSCISQICLSLNKPNWILLQLPFSLIPALLLGICSVVLGRSCRLTARCCGIHLWCGDCRKLRGRSSLDSPGQSFAYTVC